jgi:hypothetical protein
VLAKDKDESNRALVIDLFGAPPLIRGEDEDRYWKLLAAVENDLKPKEIFDWIYVREVTDKMWQQQRCRQAAASLIDGTNVEALSALLGPFSYMGGDDPTAIAREYFGGEARPKRLQELETRLAVHAISPEQVRAKAMQICGGTISMFNRMEESCAASLRMLRKEYVRRPGPNSDEPDSK